MIVQSYLSFEGRCEEAFNFYVEKLGAKLDVMMRFKDSPEPCPEGMIPPGSENKIMHMSFHVGETMLMATDGNCAGKTGFQGISLALSVPTVEEANKIFSALSGEGQVQMPIGKTFFSPAFGMVADKFGVNWMVLANP